MGKLLPLEKLRKRERGGQGERAAAAKDDLPSAPVPIGVLRCALGEGALATERARRSLAMASFGFPCGPARQVKVSAGVVMSVLDAYVRRNEGQERVVGTLLGSLNAESGTVDVRNVYAVPHNESKEQVALDIEFHRTMLELNQKINAKDAVVGWFSTGNGPPITGGDALLQEFYNHEAPHTVHLVVDVSLPLDRPIFSAFGVTSCALQEQQLAQCFHPIPVEVKQAEVERIGGNVFRSRTCKDVPDESSAVRDSVDALRRLLTILADYVGRVCDGDAASASASDNAVGRYVSDTLAAALPALSGEAVERIVQQNAQDIALVEYLAYMAKTQLALSEKLGTDCMPIL